MPRFLPAAFFLVLVGCQPDTELDTEPDDVSRAEAVTSCPDGELVIEELDEGEGDRANAEDVVRVAYTGRLEDGHVFDESEDASFPLGRVVPGFRDGIVGMQEGAARRLTIPPNLGYGSAGAGSIPPCATLVFDVELIEVVE